MLCFQLLKISSGLNLMSEIVLKATVLNFQELGFIGRKKYISLETSKGKDMEFKP